MAIRTRKVTAEPTIKCTEHTIL